MSPSSPNGRSFHPDSKATDKTHLFVSIYNDDKAPTSLPAADSQEGPATGPPPQQPHQHRHSHHPQNHRWTILVEQPPKHHRLLSLHHHHTTTPDQSAGTVLFLIGRDNSTTSSWACHSRHPDAADAENLLGKIHIGDCDAKHGTTVQIEELLRARLPPPGDEEEDGRWGERTSEHWIRAAVHALQDGGLVQKFDLDEFMTFARSYVVERSSRMMTEEEEEDLDLAPPAAIEYAPQHVGSGYGGHVGDERKHGYSTITTTSGTVAGVKNSKTTTQGRHGFWLSWPHAASSTASGSARSREPSPYGGLM